MKRTGHLNIFDANEDDKTENRQHYKVDEEMFKSANSLLSINDYKTSAHKLAEDQLLPELDLPCLQHQFNAHGNVYHLNSRISKKDLFTYNREANAKMNEIIHKLKHPSARSKMIITSDLLQRLKSLHQHSRATIDDADTAVVSLQSKNQIATVLTAPEAHVTKHSSRNIMHTGASNLLTTLNQSKRNSNFGENFSTMQGPVHPLQEKLMKMYFEHDRNKFIDPLMMKFKDFPIEDERNKFTKEEYRKLKISEWHDQQVLLPILGKNKTKVLHNP